MAKLNRKQRREAKRRAKAMQILDATLPPVLAVAKAYRELGRRPDASVPGPAGIKARAKWDKRFAAIKAAERAAMPTEPGQWRQLHSPTEPEVVRLPVVQTKPGEPPKLTHADSNVERAIVDKRLWDGLDEFQQSAIQQIDEVLTLHAGAAGYASQQFERKPKGRPGEGSDWEVDMELIWLEWSEATRSARIDVAVLITYLVDGTPLHTIDQRRGWKHGKARRHFGMALDEWCYACGWKRRPPPPDPDAPTADTIATCCVAATATVPDTTVQPS